MGRLEIGDGEIGDWGLNGVQVKLFVDNFASL
jgi:hypothetical protein